MIKWLIEAIICGLIGGVGVCVLIGLEYLIKRITHTHSNQDANNSKPIPPEPSIKTSANNASTYKTDNSRPCKFMSHGRNYRERK